jgi:hypothetical protein
LHSFLETLKSKHSEKTTNVQLNKSGRVVYPRRSPIYILGKQRG